MIDTFGAAPMLTYALVEREDVDWNKVETALEALPRAELVSWHRMFNATGEASVDAWLSKDAAMRTLFRDVLDRRTGESVLIARTSFDVDMTVWEKSDFAMQMHRMRSDGVCAFNSDALGGYTMVRLLRVAGMLVGLTCVFCVAVGMLMAGPRAILIAPALLFSYACLHAMVRLIGIPVDMIVIVCALVTPGILTDYALHLVHDSQNAFAVVFSAATSAASLVPFVTFPVESVRSFMLVYVVVIVCGCAITTAVVRGAEAARTCDPWA